MSKEKNLPVASITINELIKWADGNSPAGKGLSGKLVLPPIQRSSGLWGQRQIAEYWDSLLRGFPLGVMLIHKISKPIDCRNLLDGQQFKANEGDWALFDGQQRLSAILLGFGKGSLFYRHKLKLWVDPTQNPDKENFLFPIALSSAGQPFGYDKDFGKLSLEDRRKARKKFDEKHKNLHTPAKIFELVEGEDLSIGKEKSFQSLSIIAESIRSGDNTTHGDLHEHIKNILNGKIDMEVPLQDVSSIMPINGKDSSGERKLRDYHLYFRRIGQNGTGLTDNEYIYSVIKEKFPEIQDSFDKILSPTTDGGCGYISDPVELAIASLRVARGIVTSEVKDAIVGRPDRNFASNLDKDNNEIIAKFEEMVRDGEHSQLAKAVKHIRTTLEYHPEQNERGLPLFMLAPLPRELFDCLLLAAIKTDNSVEIERKWMIPFCLFWMALQNNDGEFANWFYSLVLGYKDKGEVVPGMEMGTKLFAKLVKDCEGDNTIKKSPRRAELDLIRDNAKIGQFLTKAKSKFRFGHEVLNEQREVQQGKLTADFLELVAWRDHSKKNILLWLQREYLHKLCAAYGSYDPTAGLDEDFPIEFDHLIPHNIFYYKLAYGSKGANLSNDAQKNQQDVGFKLHGQKVNYGNSLGNYRWFDASLNAARGDRPIGQDEKGTLLGDCQYDHLIDDYNKFNELIVNTSWSTKDIRSFEEIIDNRCFDLYRSFICDSGIDSVLSENE